MSRHAPQAQLSHYAVIERIQRAVGTSIQQNYATYTYTLNGKQQTVQDANANLTTYEYDGVNRH